MPFRFADKFSLHLTVRVGDRQRPLPIAVYFSVELELEFPGSRSLRASDDLAVAHGLSFHSEAVRRVEVVGCRRTYLDVVIRPHGGRTGVAPFEL